MKQLVSNEIPKSSAPYMHNNQSTFSWHWIQYNSL